METTRKDVTARISRAILPLADARFQSCADPTFSSFGTFLLSVLLQLRAISASSLTPDTTSRFSSTGCGCFCACSSPRWITQRKLAPLNADHCSRSTSPPIRTGAGARRHERTLLRPAALDARLEHSLPQSVYLPFQVRNDIAGPVDRSDLLPKLVDPPAKLGDFPRSSPNCVRSIRCGSLSWREDRQERHPSASILRRL